MLNDALQYAARGWRVFPVHSSKDGRCTCGDVNCDSRGKHPRTANGLKDATTDSNIIKTWWLRWPDANIGIACGKISDLLILDFDVKDGAKGRDTFQKLQKDHGTMQTRMQQTPTGGWHCLYKQPEGDYKNTVGLLPGLDIRTDGGYTIAPPSQIDGKPYRWVNDAEPATLPEGIRKILKPKGQPEQAASGEDGKVGKGKRNQHLTSLAGSMRQRGMSQEAMAAALIEENRLRCDPPLPEEDVRKIAASVHRYEPDGQTATVIRMADVKAEPIRWLWQARIALGKVSMIVGDPGLGKSIITSDIAAHVTKGAPWPVDGSHCPQGDVIMVSAEDDAADTIRPRLDAAGADVRRVYQLTMVREVIKGESSEHCFNLERDLDALEGLLVNLPETRVITIDPISAYLGGTDSHKNADVRAALTPLAALASRHKVAVICISHLNKSGSGSAMYRASGSLAFVAAARAVFAVTKDQENPERRLILPIKNNIGNDQTGLAYTIATSWNDAPVIQWEPDPVVITADEALNRVSDEEHSEREEAAEWLHDLLSAGPVDTTAIQKQAKMVGHAWRTVRRAKDLIGINARKQGFSGKWVWELPETPPKMSTKPQDVQSNTVDALGNSGHLGSDSTSTPIPTKELMQAAVTACQGLQITAGRYIKELSPDDYLDVINRPEAARAMAESLNQRGIR